MKNVTIRVDGLGDAQRGYLAGFLDGEGGIQITMSERPDREYKIALHPAVYLCNTHRGSIKEIRRWLDAGSITRRKGAGNHRDTYVLSITGVRNIRTLLTFLLPNMIIKVRQAVAMLRYCNRRLSHHRGNERRYTEEELRLYTTLKRLNKKGGGAKKTPTHGSLTKAGKHESGQKSGVRLRNWKQSQRLAPFLK